MFKSSLRSCKVSALNAAVEAVAALVHDTLPHDSSARRSASALRSVQPLTRDVQPLLRDVQPLLRDVHIHLLHSRLFCAMFSSDMKTHESVPHEHQLLLHD